MATLPVNVFRLIMRKWWQRKISALFNIASRGPKSKENEAWGGGRKQKRRITTAAWLSKISASRAWQRRSFYLSREIMEANQTAETINDNLRERPAGMLCLCACRGMRIMSSPRPIVMWIVVWRYRGSMSLLHTTYIIEQCAIAPAKIKSFKRPLLEREGCCISSANSRHTHVRNIYMIYMREALSLKSHRKRKKVMANIKTSLSIPSNRACAQEICSVWAGQAEKALDGDKRAARSGKMRLRTTFSKASIPRGGKIISWAGNMLFCAGREAGRICAGEYYAIYACMSMREMYYLIWKATYV